MPLKTDEERPPYQTGLASLFVLAARESLTDAQLRERRERILKGFENKDTPITDDLLAELCEINQALGEA